MKKENSENIKEKVDAEIEKIKKTQDKANQTIYSKVKNINELNNTNEKMLDQLLNEVKNKNSNSLESKAAVELELEAAKKLSLAMFKNIVKVVYPKKYPSFADMTFDEYADQLLNHNPTFAALDASSNQSTPVTIYANGESVSISPQMYFNNMTTILNDVSIGNNGLDLSTVFNAFDFYNDGFLTSGISKLYTMEYTATGVITLDQNMLVPQNYTVNGSTVNAATQNIAGYQSSHPVFANIPYENAGNGIGWGLFTRGNTTINVWKLSVTSPKQYAEMNLLFIQLMENSKAMCIWALATNNLFSNITNIILDNSNTNMRDCFNYSLFPNILQMTTPTQMYNLGDTVTFTNGTTSSTFNYGSTTDAELDAATSATRTGELSSSYLIQGYNTLPRINSCSRSDVHIICTPNTYVKMFSGMLSVLYNYGFQSWDFYVPKENIHLIYKKPSISVSNLNPTNGLSAHLQPVTMEDNWFSDENMLILTKPSDVNMWPATYGYIWEDIQSNQWGAAMVQTDFLHFLIYGGVTPYAQAWWYHAKGITKALANEANPTVKNIVYEKGVAFNF